MAELVGAHNMVQRVTMFILLIGPVYLYYPGEVSFRTPRLYRQDVTCARLEHNHVLSPRLVRHYVKNRKIPKHIAKDVMAIVSGKRPIPDIIEEVKDAG